MNMNSMSGPNTVFGPAQTDLFGRTVRREGGPASMLTGLYDPIAQKRAIAQKKAYKVVGDTFASDRKLDGEFVTKGDANELEDMNSVPYENLVGRVEHHFPIVGRLMVVYTGTVGKAYVICFAACGAMLNMLAGRLRDRNKEKET